MATPVRLQQPGGTSAGILVRLKTAKDGASSVVAGSKIVQLSSISFFLEKAAGFAASDPVVITFYGGGGSHHLRWRPKSEGGGAQPVLWSSSIQDEVADALSRELQGGRQLGFVAGHGGSTKERITHVTALRAEIDLPDSKELQLQVCQAVEQRFGFKFTLLDTGGKSIHAWIPASTPIPADQFNLTSRLWYELINQIAREADLDLPANGLDANLHRPTQVMRLPGCVHIKTGRVAEVIQWGDAPVELDRLGLGWPQVEEWAKRSAAPKRVIQAAISRNCKGGKFLGLSGDARVEELVSLARVVPVRVPGAGTYTTVLSLVSNLSRALGTEQAAQVLHRAGHFDKQGNDSLEGLRQWCETFEPDPERSPELLGWLAAWAEREHGWQRPMLSVSGVLEPTELVEPNPDAISKSLFKRGGGLLVCQKGTGKSEGACGYVDQIGVIWSRADRAFSVVMVTPRRTINSQFAQKLRAVNVSGQLTGKGDPFRHPGTKPNRYVCCLQSLGNPAKQNGNLDFWGEFQSLGDAGSPAVPTGRGVMAVVLILDEFRQTLTDLLLSPSGPGTLWEKPADRWRTGVALVRSILHAGVVLAMDAQAGEPEQELLRSIGRIEGERVLGSPPTEPTRIMRWTSDQNRWRDCLLGHAKARFASEKPLLVITGAKGKDGQCKRGLSARGVRDALQEEAPGIRVFIIDAESKDTEVARRLLRGEVDGWDVVICTPVAQSGVSWVGVFAETVFVAGARTLPPNICGGQAGRRERTATTCVAYVPKTVWDRSLPLWEREEDGIRAELQQARQHADELGIASGREIEILERVYVLAARRQIEELALFRDYTLHYAKVDGWATEELANVEPLSRHRCTTGAREKRSEPLPVNELDAWRELLVRTLRLQGVGAEREAAETKSAAWRETIQNMKGSAGADLVSANLAQVQEVFLKAGLGKLCDGQFRSGDDLLVKRVAEALQTPDARGVFRHATWLQLELTGSAAYPAQTVSAAVARLGGVSKSRKVGARGEQKKMYRWILPSQW